MARVIKQGKCAYSFVRQQPDCSSRGKEEHDDNFNTLYCMLPPGHNSPDSGDSCDSSGEADILETKKEQCRRLLEEARNQARALKAEAEEVLAAARARAAEIESDAYSQGYEQGQKDGEELGRKQFSVGLQHLESVIESLKKESLNLAPKYEAQMLQTCLLVAGRLVEKEIVCDRELILRVLRSCLQKAVDGSSITVHVHPRDMENLSEPFLERLASPGGNKVKVRANATVKRGGCLVETEFGLIDASLESRWKAMLEGIGETLKERTGVELDEGVRKLL